MVSIIGIFYILVSFNRKFDVIYGFVYIISRDLKKKKTLKIDTGNAIKITSK